MLVAGSAGAWAEDETIPWDVPEVRGWTIAIDTSLGGGCFMYTVFEGDASARIGFDMSAGNVYLILADLDWASIAADQSYDITLKMGTMQGWNASAAGGRLGDIPTLTVTSTDPDFIEEFASQNNITVNYRSSEIMNLSLHGSRAALNEMLVCQNAVEEALKTVSNQGGGGASDPFANGGGGGGTKPNDPFAN